MSTKKESNSTSKGIGLFNLLGIVFIVLKLCNVIDWSWWYVAMPLYGPYAIALLIFVICSLAIGAIEVVQGMIEGKHKKKNNFD